MENQKENKISFFDLVIIILSIYVLFALMVDTFFHLDKEVSSLLAIIDDFICIIFLYDFIYRFVNAPSKKSFMKWGWIDLVSSIPTFSYLRFGRLFRLIRILRILRAVRSIKHITSHIFKSRIQGTFSMVALISLLMLIFGSISILQVETSPESNIKTASDAIWWAFVTITTVGYGDKFPVTSLGRIISAFLMITGVGLFGTFTGFITSWFMKERKSE